LQVQTDPGITMPAVATAASVSVADSCVRGNKMAKRKDDASHARLALCLRPFFLVTFLSKVPAGNGTACTGEVCCQPAGNVTAKMQVSEESLNSTNALIHVHFVDLGRPSHSGEPAVPFGERCAAAQHCETR